MITYIDSPNGVLEKTAERVCPKCQQANPSDASVCGNCQRHLVVFCRHCGHPNNRSDARCTECRTQLHVRWPAKWKQARARTWIRPATITMVVVSAILAAKAIVMIGSVDFPTSPSEPAPPVYVINSDGKL